MVEDFGIKSMLCTQLFTNEKQLGALNIYSTESDAFDEEDQEVGPVVGCARRDGGGVCARPA